MESHCTLSYCKSALFPYIMIGSCVIKHPSYVVYKNYEDFFWVDTPQTLKYLLKKIRVSNSVISDVQIVDIFG